MLIFQSNAHENCVSSHLTMVSHLGFVGDSPMPPPPQLLRKQGLLGSGAGAQPSWPEPSYDEVRSFGEELELTWPDSVRQVQNDQPGAENPRRMHESFGLEMAKCFERRALILQHLTGGGSGTTGGGIAKTWNYLSSPCRSMPGGRICWNIPPPSRGVLVINLGRELSPM